MAKANRRDRTAGKRMFAGVGTIGCSQDVSVVQEKNSVWMQRVMYRPGQAGEMGVVGILRHERGGCKNEVWR